MYHGTMKENVDNVLLEGLSRMDRQCVHLSFTVEGEGKSGGCRSGTDAVVVVNVEQAIGEGYKFG